MHIVFVSEDDLVRGPMARGLAQMMATEMKVKHAIFESAGIDVTTTLGCPEEVVHFLADRNMNLRKHTTSSLSMGLVRRADMIMCMTHQIRRKVRQTIGAPHDAKVLVLNESIGFGNTPKKQDITGVTMLSESSLMSVHSQLKASVGRLVRYIGDGDEVEDFGGKKVEDTTRGPLDSPQTRQFVSHYIIEFISRSFEPPDAEAIAEHLHQVGQMVSAIEVEELCTNDLKNRLQRNAGGCYEIQEKEPPRATDRNNSSSTGNGANAFNGAFNNGQSARTPKPTSGRMTAQEAFDVLSITDRTPKSEARKSLKKLLTRYHPDKFHDDPDFRVMAEEKAKQINLAWETIEDKLAD